MGDWPFNTNCCCCYRCRCENGTWGRNNEALKISRESEVDSSDTTISKNFKGARTKIWAKSHSQPNRFILTRDELDVLIYF